MLGDTLVTLDFDMKTVRPGLAKSWTVSPDGKTYTFNLRDDVTFCDGKKMTADDVVYSIKRWADPATRSPVAWRAGPIDDVVAINPTTVEYRLKAPTPSCSTSSRSPSGRSSTRPTSRRWARISA